MANFNFVKRKNTFGKKYKNGSEEMTEPKYMCPKCGSKDIKEDKRVESTGFDDWEGKTASTNIWGYTCEKCGTFFTVGKE